MILVRRVGCEDRAWTTAFCEHWRSSWSASSMLATSGLVEDLQDYLAVLAGFKLLLDRNQRSGLKPTKIIYMRHVTWSGPDFQKSWIATAPQGLQHKWAQGESTEQKPTSVQADTHSILSTMACSLLNAIQSVQSYTQLLNEVTKPLAWLFMSLEARNKQNHIESTEVEGKIISLKPHLHL